MDNIILMALRKEPQRRYSSVEQFAGDIRRHLQSLPVIARKDTFSYRASKFITRHRGAVAAGVVVTLVLLAGVMITRREAQIARAQQARAERRFNDLRQLAHSLVFEIHDSIEAVPGTIAARKLITQRSLEYLDSLAQEAEGEWSLQRELAAAYTKVGDVQGQSYNANLGDTQGALASYRRALAIRQTLAVVDPEDSTNRLELAKSHNGGRWKLIAEVTEVESGKKNHRPALDKALGLFRIHDATLVIAKLDRLARNVAFISNLMEAGVDFIAVDFPQANRLTVHILAAVAEHEAAMISARTKAALAAAKKRGVKLGGDRAGIIASQSPKGVKASMKVRRENAQKRAADLLPEIEAIQAEGATSLRQIAHALTERGIPAPRGGAWQAVQVQRVLNTL